MTTVPAGVTQTSVANGNVGSGLTSGGLGALIGGITGGFVLLAGMGIYFIYRRNRAGSKSWDEPLAFGETHVRSTTTQGTMEEVEPVAEEQDRRPRRGGRLRYN